MELRHHLGVLRDYWYVVLAGAAVGVLLALLVLFKPGWDGGPKLEPRQPEIWSSSSKLYLTKNGFPEGRAIPPAQETAVPTAPLTDRLGDLAYIYSGLVSSDNVTSRVGEMPPGGAIIVQNTQAEDRTPLPFLDLTTSATRPVPARNLNRRTISALQDYVTDRANETGVPIDQRVKLEILNAPAPAVVTEPRGKTGAIAAFLLSLLAGVGMAYVLANLALRTGGVGAERVTDRRPGSTKPRNDNGTSQNGGGKPSKPASQSPEDEGEHEAGHPAVRSQ